MNASKKNGKMRTSFAVAGSLALALVLYTGCMHGVRASSLSSDPQVPAKKEGHGVASVKQDVAGCGSLAQDFLAVPGNQALRAQALQRGNAVPQATYLSHLHVALLGREPDQSTGAMWSAALHTNALTVEEIERSLLEGSAFKKRCAAIGMNN